MSLTLDALAQQGGFVGSPVEKQITWRQGDDEHTATVYVRPLSYKSAVSDMTAFNADGDLVAGRIAASICDETGKPVFTVGDITGESNPERGPLSGAITIELMRVIAEVNGLGKS